MSLSARINRLEQKRGAHDPFADMTDEELEMAIERVKALIEESTGMPMEEYAAQLQRDIDEGKPSPFEDPSVHAFLASMKKDFKRAYDQVRSST